MNQTCNIVELFSGIGSQAKALKNLGYKVNTLGTCEWDLHAFIAYDAIHSSPELPETIARMGKAEILKKLESYTLSNNGKEKWSSRRCVHILKSLFDVLLQLLNETKIMWMSVH